MWMRLYKDLSVGKSLVSGTQLQPAIPAKLYQQDICQDELVLGEADPGVSVKVILEGVRSQLCRITW